MAPQTVGAHGIGDPPGEYPVVGGELCRVLARATEESMAVRLCPDNYRGQGDSQPGAFSPSSGT